MALTIAEPTAEVASTSNVASYALGAFTPSANARLFVLVVCTGSTTAGSMANTGSTMASAWRLLASIAFNTTDIIELWTARTPASGNSSSTITYTKGGAGNATGCVLSIISVTCGAGSSVEVVQSDAEARTGANPVVTMPAALATGNGYFAGFGMPRNPPTSTPPGSWTEIADTGYTVPAAGASAAYRSGGETGTTITFTSLSAAYGIAAVEFTEIAAQTVNTSPSTLACSSVAPTLPTTFAPTLSTTAAASVAPSQFATVASSPDTWSTSSVAPTKLLERAASLGTLAWTTVDPEGEEVAGGTSTNTTPSTIAFGSVAPTTSTSSVAGTSSATLSAVSPAGATSKNPGTSSATSSSLAPAAASTTSPGPSALALAALSVAAAVAIAVAPSGIAFESVQPTTFPEGAAFTNVSPSSYALGSVAPTTTSSTSPAASSFARSVVVPATEVLLGVAPSAWGSASVAPTQAGAEPARVIVSDASSVGAVVRDAARVGITRDAATVLAIAVRDRSTVER